MNLRLITPLIILITIENIVYSQITTEIFLNKNEYLEAEPIIFTIKFKNISSLEDSIIYYPLEEYGTYLKISSDNEKKIKYYGMTVGFIKTPYIKIKPKQEIVKTCNLIDLLGDIKLKHSLNGRHTYLTEGNYNIFYETKGSEYATNVLMSNKLTFRIIKPMDRDLEAFEKLIRAYQINDGNPWIMDSILLKREIYYDVAVNYPESKYFEEAVYRYNEETEYLHVDKLDIEMDKLFIEKFPESNFMFTVLRTLCIGIYKFEGGETPVNEYLNYLIVNYPNFRVSYEAKVILANKTYLN